MTPEVVTAFVILIALTPFWLAFGVARFRARRRLAAWLAEPRAIPDEVRRAWQARGWLAPGWDARALPRSLSLTTTLAEWAAADPDLLLDLHLSRTWRRLPEGSLDELVGGAWEALPAAARERTEARLRAALKALDGWYSGAERGWTGRPFVLPKPLAPRGKKPLPGVVVDDATAAPRPGPLAPAAAEAASGPELALLYALQRRAAPRFIHPLAVTKESGGPLGELAEGAASRVGRQVGARLGSGFGAVGSALGQYLGGLAGQLAGGAARRQTLPDDLQAAFAEVERALQALGAAAAGAEFQAALEEPERRVLARGGRWERARARRARAWREKLWPTLELAVAESCMEDAWRELCGLRELRPTLAKTLAEAPPLQRGGFLLQNPWLVRRLPDGPERLSAARAALNAAARQLAQYR